MVISNHVYGYLQSPEIAVQPNEEYRLSAWMRGEIDHEESAGNWILRAYYYDANHNGLSYTNVAVSSSASTILRLCSGQAWSEKSGDFTTPSNAAYVRVQLYNYMNSGWIAWDDVSLLGPGTVTRKYYYAGGTRVAMQDDGTLSLAVARQCQGLPAERPSHAALGTIAWAARPSHSTTLRGL